MEPLHARAHRDDRDESNDGSAAEHILDRAHLARYTGGEPALEREILGLFLEQAATLIEKLAGSQAPDSWRFAAHSLKGSARAVGAWELAALAERAEKMPSEPPAEEAECAGGPDGECAAHAAIIAELREAYGRVAAACASAAEGD